jgi:hypothetical protein
VVLLLKVELEEVVLTRVALTLVTFIESEPLIDPKLVGGGVVALLAAVVEPEALKANGGGVFWDHWSVLNNLS